MPVYAPVEPQTLKWARENAGYGSVSEAAAAFLESSKITESELKEWEEGNKRLTLGKAKELAKKYNISLPVLYLDKVPEEWNFMPPHDFRGFVDDKIKPNLRCAIMLAQDRQKWASEILESEGKEFKRPKTFNMRDGSETLALKIHEWLGKPTKPQDPNKWLDEWIAKVEDNGVFVMQTHKDNSIKTVSSEEFSGCSLDDNYLPVVLLNSYDNKARRLFTLFHELAHLWLNEPGISHVNDEGIKPPNARIEKFCNEVAAQILLPREALIKYWQNFSGAIDEKIKKINKNTGASSAAIAFNLTKHEIISNLECRNYLNYLKIQQEKKQEQNRNNPYCPPPQHLQTVRRCGTKFSLMVLYGYEQGLINCREMSGLLGMKLNHINKLTEKLNIELYGWK